MGTIWGYHYADGGFDCNLVLDYSSSENIAENYSTVNWAVRITGYFPGYRNWIMGKWKMKLLKFKEVQTSGLEMLFKEVMK